ncbi:class I SAM-dependent methyltransferase [Coralliovum pocilloporae]|uniref:class I SAM-dependent methyltransferase n=1 Tax=Coralliovum pocilloporae TaxID=3066369 RepID=UPI003306BE51
MAPGLSGMNETDAQTLEFYDSDASAYAERQPHKKDEEALNQFMEHLPEGSAVCDLGCGNGWASAKLIEHGFQVTAVDGSAGLALEANRNYGVSVNVMTFEDFKYHATFHGLWACWSLYHSPRANFPKLLKRVSDSVIPGGVLFISVKGGTGESRDSFGRFYSYFEWNELKDIIETTVDGIIINQDSWSDKCFEGKNTLLHQVLIRKSG